MAKRIPGSSVRLCPKEPGANFRTTWKQGLWTCAVGIPATVVRLAHKVATTVCPPPRSDISYGGFVPIDDTDLDTTTGCHSAGAQIDLVAAFCRLYDDKCVLSFFCFVFVRHSRLTG
jgi:hypothetical protein